MWGTKRGVMVHFLVSLLICLMIFIPACLMASKIFRTSEQARDNYSEFVSKLTEFAAKGQVGEGKSLLLIMDDKTAIVYFERGTAKEVTVEVDAEPVTLDGPQVDYTMHLLKPGQCDDAQNCLCLFRESSFDVEGLFLIEDYEVTVNPERVLCANIDFNVEVDSCSIGKAHGVNSYTCSNGFMIERHMADGSSWQTTSYYELPRRTILYFTKSPDVINLIGNYGGTNEEE